jgi:hypothetical protein
MLMLLLLVLVLLLMRVMAREKMVRRRVSSQRRQQRLVWLRRHRQWERAPGREMEPVCQRRDSDVSAVCEWLISVHRFVKREILCVIVI